jgi:putative membrane protein
MERQKINLKKLIIFALAIFYLVGIFIHLFFRSSEFLKILTPLFLMLTSAAVFFEDKQSKKFLIWFLVGYFFTLFIEIVGVKTSLIFGPYKYGENMGIKFYGVPLVIGLNWVVLIIAAE